LIYHAVRGKSAAVYFHRVFICEELYGSFYKMSCTLSQQHSLPRCLSIKIPP